MGVRPRALNPTGNALSGSYSLGSPQVSQTQRLSLPAQDPRVRLRLPFVEGEDRAGAHGGRAGQELGPLTSASSGGC